MTLRHGFTTGTAAAAAAKAAALHLLEGSAMDTVDVPLPMGERMNIAILESRVAEGGILAAVVKDAGDDPDVTHRAVIRALVRPSGEHGIRLRGGTGVGVVTRPGLPVPVGQAAINPVPREQIHSAVAEALQETGAQRAGFAVMGLDVEIRVDKGEAIALRTFNPRLGIVGGISILGTRGTVKPFSNAAWAATIRQCLDVMDAAGIQRPCLTTGGRTERFLRQARPETTDTACVQAADFFFLGMREAGRRGFSSALWGVFFGKLVKQAQGHRYTHARSAHLDFDVLAGWCRQCGLPASVCTDVAGANTAMQVLEMVGGRPQAASLFALLTGTAARFASEFSGRGMPVDYLLFDFDGRVLHDTSEAA